MKCGCGEWELPEMAAAMNNGEDPSDSNQSHEHYVALLCPVCHGIHTFVSPLATEEMRRQGLQENRNWSVN